MSDSSIVNSSSVQESIPTEVGLAAARTVAEIARQHDIEIALAGGIAMHVYGFTRATTEVDMLAYDVLPLDAKRRITSTLTF